MRRILVIEDEEAILEEVLDWLAYEEFEAVGAANGRLGLDAALATPPDLIVCDITMPEMDGYQVLLELRKHKETSLVPFIFLTARADRSFMRHGMELGADDYLTKPFSRAELLAAIRSRLERHQTIADVHERGLEETKIKLSNMVANELRAPLSSVNKVKQIIEHQIEQLSADEVKDLLQTLSVGTERLHHLVEQMVYMTYLETGQLSHPQIFEKPSLVYMWQIVPSVVDLARSFADRNRAQEIKLDIRNGDAAVIADTAALKHALAELIANALNQSNDEQGVSVTQWKTEKSVWISIVDKGMGVPPVEQLQALLPYHAINQSGQDADEKGLALTISEQIIAAHGGEMTLNPVEGEGTQIVICLPLLGAP
jgi:two-component system, sensor histidine kinase and response regulator